MDGSSELQKFYLIRNRIDGMESARCLSRSLKTHARITELHLTHCDLGSSQEILLVILQSDNSFIDLRHNSTLWGVCQMCLHSLMDRMLMNIITNI